MKTINTILEYNLSEEEVEGLLACGIINWCWAKNWFSFDEFIMREIQYLPVFDESKKQELFCDLKRICMEHDLDYRVNKWFRKSNYTMAKKVYSLVHWLPFRYRLAIFLTLYILLNRYWKEAYND